MFQTNDKSRVIVITGGGHGIGRAAALLCAKRGDSVCLLDLDASAAEVSANECLKNGAYAALALQCDVSDEPSVMAALERSGKELGPVWGLFANAGIDRGGPIHQLDLGTWQEVIRTNLTGTFLTCKHALRQMLVVQSGGSIVCTSSPGSLVAFAAGGAAAYSASKAGVSSLVRSIAIEYARFSIRANSIVPGATETGLMWSRVPESGIMPTRVQLQAQIPLGRLATAEEPAGAAAWLLSDASSYVTGSQLVCDGGVLAKSSLSV